MNRSHETQIEKYGGMDGYRAEMRRRRSLVKNPGYFNKADKLTHKMISRKGGLGRANKNAHNTTGASAPEEEL